MESKSASVNFPVDTIRFIAIFLIIFLHSSGYPYKFLTSETTVIDFDSYKNNILEEQAIKLENEDAEIEPVPLGTISTVNEPDLDTLSNIINEFNTRFGDIQWSDSDKIKKQIAELPNEVAKSEAYQNAMKNSDKATAKIESDAALMKAVLQSMTSGVELFKQFQDNPSFKKWLQEFVFMNTFNNPHQPIRR